VNGISRAQFLFQTFFSPTKFVTAKSYIPCVGTRNGRCQSSLCMGRNGAQHFYNSSILLRFADFSLFRALSGTTHKESVTCSYQLSIKSLAKFRALILLFWKVPILFRGPDGNGNTLIQQLQINLEEKHAQQHGPKEAPLNLNNFVPPSFS